MACSKACPESPPQHLYQPNTFQIASNLDLDNKISKLTILKQRKQNDERLDIENCSEVVMKCKWALRGIYRIFK